MTSTEKYQFITQRNSSRTRRFNDRQELRTESLMVTSNLNHTEKRLNGKNGIQDKISRCTCLICTTVEDKLTPHRYLSKLI